MQAATYTSAGIAVPRAGGTCTRCAFEISTQDAAEDFRCVVSVRGADFPRCGHLQMVGGE